MTTAPTTEVTLTKSGTLTTNTPLPLTERGAQGLHTAVLVHTALTPTTTDVSQTIGTMTLLTSQLAIITTTQTITTIMTNTLTGQLRNQTLRLESSL